MKAVVFYTFVLIILYRFNPLDDPVAIQDDKINSMRNFIVYLAII